MSAEYPTKMRALVVEKPGSLAVKPDWPVPELGDDEVLVKVSHVALNPTDWKHADWISNPDSILGCDYSGKVQSVGSSVKRLQVGDRVCGAVHGGKFPNKGSFAEYLVVKDCFPFKVPDSLGDAEASTFGIGFGTAALTVYHAQKYSYDSADQRQGWFIVSGGSTSVGLFTLSLLRQLGIKTIATASPHSFDLVKSYGADHVVDYHDKEAALAEIKSVTGGGVVGGLEAVGGTDNYQISANAFGENGGTLTTLLPATDEQKAIRKDVNLEGVLMYTVFGLGFDFIPGKMYVPAAPKDKQWFVDLVKREDDGAGLLSKTKPNPVDLRVGGLDAVTEGLDLLRKNKVSGKKLVYKFD